MEFTVSELIAAAPDEVYRVLIDVERSAEVLPGVSRVEVLSEERSGAGLKWRESRRMMGRDASIELEIVEATRPHRLKIESRVMNTSYESTFTITAASGGTHLAHDFKSVGGGFLAGIIEKMTAGTMKSSMQADLAAIKSYCEGHAEELV